MFPRGNKEVPVRLLRNRRMDSGSASVLGDTMGSEQAVLVMIDPAEFPKNWTSVNVLANQLGDAQYRVQADANPESIPLPTEWGSMMQCAAADLGNSCHVSFGDRHLDAKMFPALHPHGSGSVYGEEGSGGRQQHAKNRLLSLEPAFRHSPVWCFLKLELQIKSDLYFKEKGRKEQKRDGGGAVMSLTDADTVPVEGDPAAKRPDVYAELFGRVEPRDIPESREWWKARTTELMRITDDHELQLPTGMVTITQNDSSPELLAHARRGPCARPTQQEMAEYLLTRHAPGERRANVQQDATAAVLSFQRRTQACKLHFLCRHRRTPLGVATAYWDRTQAQQS